MAITTEKLEFVPSVMQLARIEKGFSINELARKMKVAVPIVWRWETGKSAPRPENIKKLAKALGISVSSMLTTPE